MYKVLKRTVYTLLLFITASNTLAAAEVASKDELYTGKEFSNAFANPQDDPSRPNVLLIGDSISIGYTVAVRKLLQGKADVFRIPTNGRYSSYGLQNIEKWLGQRKWDIIHFNWGLWDICYRHPKAIRDKVNGTLTATPDKYRESMKGIVGKLKKTNAKLIWCETTPVPEFEEGRIMGDEIKYNLIAEKIMKQNKIAINRLHAHALVKLPGIMKKKGDVHFSKIGYAYLAENVAKEISLLIKK